MATADQSLLEQIQRLSGALRRARDVGPSKPTNNLNPIHTGNAYQYSRGRGGYNSRYIPPRQVHAPPKSVEIGGQVFTASNNKLTRQTETSSSSSLANVTQYPSQAPNRQRFMSSRGRPPKSYAGNRVYKPKTRKHANLSLIINKPNRPMKKPKPCPFFTRTGTCNRGKSCRYQHDPEKVAICPRYLVGDCPQTAENCLLSHEATLNRVPPCIHFQNNGKCKNGDHCIYPHVRFGTKDSVCRDFAVLGYCEKGIDCDGSHVRECPDFAETGACKNPRCKLPHVIRANRKHNTGDRTRSHPTPTIVVAKTGNEEKLAEGKKETSQKEKESVESSNDHAGNDVQLPMNGKDYTFEGGDEYIPLTFIESEEDEDSDEDLDNSEEEDDESKDEIDQEGEMKVFA